MTIAGDRVRRIAATVIPVASLAILLPTLWRHSSQLREYHWHISPPLLMGSYAVLFAGFMLVVFVWQLLLGRLGLFLRFRRAFEIWYLTNVGRYLPGKVWGVVWMIHLCEKEGIPKSKAVASGVITQLFSIATAFVLGCAYLIFAKAASLKAAAHWLPVLLVSVGIFFALLISPKLCLRPVHFILRVFGKPELPFTLGLSDRMRFFGLHTLCWLVYGVSFGLFVLSITDVPHTRLLLLIPTFALAYTLGYIAVLAPSGLGVREGVMVLLLSAFLPATLAIAVAIAARLWFTVGELLFFVVAWRLQSPLKL